MSNSNNPTKTLFTTGPDPGNEVENQVIALFAETDWIMCAAGVHETADESDPYHHAHVLWRLSKAVRPKAFAKFLRESDIAMHVQPLHGTPAQCLTYISKENTPWTTCAVPSDWTKDPNQDKSQLRNLKRTIDDLYQKGETRSKIIDALYDQHFPSMIRYDKTIRGYLNYKTIKETKASMNIVWHYGPTGSGKSHACPKDAYWKPPENHWFDGYQCEKKVVLDEFRKNWWTFSYCLRLFDVYPLMVQVKGGFIQWCATEVHITSPYHPRELYSTHEDLNQLLRRITVVYRHYKEGDEYKIEEADKYQAIQPVSNGFNAPAVPIADDEPLWDMTDYGN